MEEKTNRKAPEQILVTKTSHELLRREVEYLRLRTKVLEKEKNRLKFELAGIPLKDCDIAKAFVFIFVCIGIMGLIIKFS